MPILHLVQREKTSNVIQTVLILTYHIIFIFENPLNYELTVLLSILKNIISIEYTYLRTMFVFYSIFFVSS